MDHFYDTFMVLDSHWSLWAFSVPLKKDIYTGLEQHEGEQIMTEF